MQTAPDPHPELPLNCEPVMELDEHADWLMPCGPVMRPEPWRLSIWQRIWPMGERRAAMEAERTEHFREQKMEEVWRENLIKPIHMMRREIAGSVIEIRLAFALVDFSAKRWGAWKTGMVLSV